MSFDLFMNDTCPRCRKPIKLTGIEQDPTRCDLSVVNLRHSYYKMCINRRGKMDQELFLNH